MTIPRPPVLPYVTEALNAFNRDLVEEVAKDAADNKVLVVGVSGLSPGKAAHRMLEEKGIAHKYVEYGSYFSGWRRRLALKIWIGWPTFPLIFIKGTFIGGNSDLKKLDESGELQKMLA